MQKIRISFLLLWWCLKTPICLCEASFAPRREWFYEIVESLNFGFNVSFFECLFGSICAPEGVNFVTVYVVEACGGTIYVGRKYLCDKGFFLVFLTKGITTFLRFASTTLPTCFSTSPVSDIAKTCSPFAKPCRPILAPPTMPNHVSVSKKVISFTNFFFARLEFFLCNQQS